MPMALSQVLLDLRRTNIVERVNRDPRTLGDLTLGIDPQTAMEAINWGQADFDESLENLSSDDRVLLYAYWNQLGHLEELSEAFGQMFSTNRPSEPFIVVDIGCGPFTGGLAFAGQLASHECFDYIGVDRSRAMQRLGAQLAFALESMDDTPRVNCQWASNLPSIVWHAPLSWRPIVVIVSFLLASPSLEVERLLADLERLLGTMSRGETTVLYTNSPKAGPNRRFPVFERGLTNRGFRLVADDTGPVHTERGTRDLRYALFRRGPERILRLGGN